MARLKLSVDQVVAAIELLDTGEQAALRERLLRWFAGLETLGGDEQREWTPPARPWMDEEPGFTAGSRRFAWQDASIAEELDLFDELLALEDDGI